MGRTDKEIYRVIDNVNSYYRINSESKKELLLNKYPNAAAAYSLRLLDGYYRGPLVRVRRDDGVEVDVYPDYNNQLSLDSLVTNVPVHTTNDGIPDEDYTFQLSLSSLGEFVGATGYSDNVAATDATVCVWYDQSSTDGVPNDNDASQDVATSQPLIVSSGVIVEEGGRAAIQGTENNILFMSSSIIGAGDYSVYTAHTYSEGDMLYGGESPTFGIWDINGDILQRFDNGTNAALTASYVDGDRILSYQNRASGAWEISVNGGTPATEINTASLTIDRLLTGFGVGYRFVGKVQELVFYEFSQSTNRTDIEEDINSFYQIDGYTPPPKLIDLTQDLAVENGGTIADGTPAAAYSLRLLSSTYNGPLVRIRRTIDNTEVDVYPDSDGEFSIYSTIEDGGTELTTNVTGGSTDKTTLHEFLYGQDTDCMVVRWYDQASGNHATQIVATNQPKVYDSATGVVTENGKPAVDFNSTSHVLPLQVHGHSAATIFETLQTSDTLLINYSGQAGPYYSWVAHSGDTNTTVYNNFGTPSMFVDGSAVSISTRGDVHAATATGSQILRTTTNASTSAWTLSKYSGFGSYEFIGTLQEFIVYGSDQSSNRTVIEQNINQHYNIY